MITEDSKSQTSQSDSSAQPKKQPPITWNIPLLAGGLIILWAIVDPTSMGSSMRSIVMAAVSVIILYLYYNISKQVA